MHHHHRVLTVPVAAALVVLSPTASSGGLPDDIGRRPDPAVGWICYWLCYGACVLVGNTGDECDAACTDSCFTITDRSTCGPGTDRICA